MPEHYNEPIEREYRLRKSAIEAEAQEVEQSLLERINQLQKTSLAAPQIPLPQGPNPVQSTLLGGLQGLFAHIAGGPGAVAQVNQQLAAESAQRAAQAQAIKMENLRQQSFQRLNELKLEGDITDLKLQAAKLRGGLAATVAQLEADAERERRELQRDDARQAAPKPAQSRLQKADPAVVGQMQQALDLVRNRTVIELVDKDGNTLSPAQAENLRAGGEVVQERRRPASLEELIDASDTLLSHAKFTGLAFGDEADKALWGEIQEATDGLAFDMEEEAAAAEEITAQRTAEDAAKTEEFKQKARKEMGLADPEAARIFREQGPAQSLAQDFLDFEGAFNDLNQQLDLEFGPEVPLEEQKGLLAGLQRSGEGILKGLGRGFGRLEPAEQDSLLNAISQETRSAVQR